MGRKADRGVPSGHRTARYPTHQRWVKAPTAPEVTHWNVPTPPGTLTANATRLTIYNLSKPARYRRYRRREVSVGRFFQIRNDNKPVDQRVYPTLAEAAGVLVRQHASDCEVVELDNPAGAVVQRFTFAQCQKITRAVGGTL